MKKVFIIGGGASGLATAINAKTDTNEVYILEKNNICGKKILATGNGRCNYFNDNQDITNYFSYSNKINDFINEENILKVRNFFDRLGFIPKIKNGYYYPLSNQASSIREILVNKVLELGIDIICNYQVEKIEKHNNGYLINDEYFADILVISTGSLVMNNNTFGYDFLGLNHNIEKVLPSLVQLRGEENYFNRWNGVRCDVNIRLFEDDNFIREETGEIQLTNYGISGICTFNLSGYISRGINKVKNEYVIIDFIPLLSFDKLRNRFNNMIELSIKEILLGIVNDKLIDTILNIINIDSGKKNISNDELELIIKSFKEHKLVIKDTNSFDKAQVCTGGVSLDDININTMMSLKNDNLYITGEVLDIDGVCGGYNLTVAWLSGILAGSDISDKD